MQDNRNTDPGAPPEVAPTTKRNEPEVRAISARDIADALARGVADFRAAPLFGVFFGSVYALGGIVVTAMFVWLGMSYLAYPLLVAFALVGPFIAVGLYEVSRRRETGEPLRWGAILGVIFSQRKSEISWMAFVTLFILIMWMYQIRLLLALFLGFQSFASFTEFLIVVVSTPEGLAFLAVGHLVGAVLSIILFSLTVVSFPILLDRDLDFVTAMITSVRSVVTSPVPMVGWAMIIVFTLIFAALPAFLGLIIVLPVLGHTTWHLYRKLVVPEETESAQPAAKRPAR